MITASPIQACQSPKSKQIELEIKQKIAKKLKAKNQINEKKLNQTPRKEIEDVINHRDVSPNPYKVHSRYENLTERR